MPEKTSLSNVLPSNMQNVLAQYIEEIGELKLSGQLEKVAATLVDSLEENSECIVDHCKLLLIYDELKKESDAERVFYQLLKISYTSPETALEIANFFANKTQWIRAIHFFRGALAWKENFFEAHLDFGRMLIQCGNVGDEALFHFSRALQLKPESIDAQCGLAATYRDMGFIEKAIIILEDITNKAPLCLEAWGALGGIFHRLGHFNRSDAAFRYVIAHEKEGVCSRFWSTLLQNQCYIKGDQAKVFDLYKEWASFFKQGTTLFFSGHPHNPEKRLRIGLVSGDLRFHSVSFFIEFVLRHLDRKQFELFAYSNYLTTDQRMHELKQFFNRWRDVFGLSDATLAEKIKEDRVDILIDLSGHTGHNRLAVFAMKPAPVQVTWIGYPATTGLDTIDYRFTDALVDPEGEADLYHTEKLWRLPHGFLCFTPSKHAPNVSPLPALETRLITFGSFNAKKKIGHECVELWSNVLKAVPNSRLLIKSGIGLDDAQERRLLTDQFVQQGVTADRIVVRGCAPTLKTHLDKYAEVDIALDSIPYNGTTTTCEALWMGVPVISLVGDRHVSRVGFSLLTHAGLGDLVAHTEGEYVELAINLASDIEKLSTIRQTLRDYLKNSQLFDGKRMAEDITCAFRSMWHAYCDKYPQTTDFKPDLVGLEKLPSLAIGQSTPVDGWEIFHDESGDGIDHVGDMGNLNRFTSDAFKEVLCPNIIQRLPVADVIGYVRSLHRILAPGGKLYIAALDLDMLAWMLSRPGISDAEKFNLMRIIYGKQADQYDFNKTGLTSGLLKRYLEDTGFERLEQVGSFGFVNDLAKNNSEQSAFSMNFIAYK